MAKPRTRRRWPIGRPLPILLVPCLLAPVHATPALAQDAKTIADAPAPGGAGPVAQPGLQPASVAASRPQPPAAAGPPVPPPVVPEGTPAEIAGDRADAIAHDIVLHPPQKQVPQQDSSHLRTVKLKLAALLDRSVHGSENTEVGRVIDVMVGDDGKPAALVLDVGGFMGVGNRRIAVAWTLFDIARPGGEPLRVALTEAQVKSAPASEGSGQVAVVMGADAAVAAPARPPAAPVSAAAPVAPGTGAGAPALSATDATGTGPAAPPAGSAPDRPGPARPAPSQSVPSRPAAIPAGPETTAPRQPWRAGTPPPPGDRPPPAADGRR